MLRTPEITVSTSVGSDTSWGGCGHGHAMAGGERFSGKVVGLAREGGGARGEGNRVEGSPRFFWCCWRGRGGTGSGESTEGSFGGRRRKQCSLWWGIRRHQRRLGEPVLLVSCVRFSPKRRR